MQLPDAAAGKQGKCPKCANVITVPAAAMAAAPLSAHDEEFWSDLNAAQKPQEKKDEGHGHGPKKSDAKLLKSYLTKEDEEKVIKRIGLPWENPRNGTVLERFWDTSVAIMNHPKMSFAEMRLQGGIGQPFIFTLLGVTMGTFFAALYATVGFVIFGMAAVNLAEPEQKNTAIIGLVVMSTIVFFGGFFGGIFGTLLHIFLQAAGLQLSLMITGVKDISFEKTFRITGYTNGAISLCNIVPGIGAGFMMGLWFAGMINGIVSVYNVKTGKATLAILLLFLPLILPILAVTAFLVFGLMYGG